MPRFFIDENALSGDIITVTGGDAVHIGRSLRMKTGDELVFCRQGTEYGTVIEKMTSDSVICRVKSSAPSAAEPQLRLTVYQAFPKGDKAEVIVQKCTELGAAGVTFFLSSRCVSRPDGKSAAKKLDRLRKIAEEAAKQSGRGMIPEVRGIVSFDEAVTMLTEENEIPLICYENEGGSINGHDYRAALTCGVMIGSEGGFDRAETEKAVAAGALPVWLGRRILRCETCPAAVTAVIMNLSGDLG